MSATETGVMVRLPGGSRFWHRAADAATGTREMDAIHDETGVYGPNYRHADTVVEFGAVDAGGAFTPATRLRPAAAPTPPGA